MELEQHYHNKRHALLRALKEFSDLCAARIEITKGLNPYDATTPSKQIEARRWQEECTAANALERLLLADHQG